MGDPSLDRFVAQQVAQHSLEGFVEASLGEMGLLASDVPEAPDAATERLQNLWKELINRAYSSLDDRLSIQASWNPAAHPRGPDGKFVERPYDIPDSIRDLSTGSILKELASEDPDFGDKVADVGIDGVLDVDESLDDALERINRQNISQMQMERSLDDLDEHQAQIEELADGEFPLVGLNESTLDESLEFDDGASLTPEAAGRNAAWEMTVAPDEDADQRIEDLRERGYLVREYPDSDEESDIREFLVGVTDETEAPDPSGPDIPEDRLGPPLSSREMQDLEDGSQVMVDGVVGDYVTQNRDQITILTEDGDYEHIRKRNAEVRRVFDEAEGGTPAQNRSNGVDTVPWGSSIDPEDMSEGDWVAYREYGQRKQIQVTEIDSDFNGNTLVKGTDQRGKEKTVRPSNIGGDFHESSEMQPYPDVGLSWPDDPEARQADIRESLDQWVPLGEDSIHPSADKNPIGPQQSDQIKDFLAEHLAQAKDKETANRAIGSLIELGDSVSRAYDGSRGSVGDADRGVIAMQNISENTAKHEMGHRIGKVWGMDGQDNTLAHNHRGTVPDASRYGFTSQSNVDPARKYSFDDPDEGVGSAWGEDVWRDKVDQEVGPGLDGRNFSSVSDGWDPEEGEMVRFEENPVAGFSDSEDTNQIWRVAEVNPPEKSSRKADVLLENWNGDTFEAEVNEKPVSGKIEFKTKDPNETEGFLPDLAGSRSETPDNWGMFDKDPDEYLGSGPVSDDPQERFDELAIRVNEAWYRQAKLGGEIGETEADMSTIISAYSSTNAHETISQLNEVMQGDRSSYEMSRAARALTQYHPELLEAYRHTFDIGNPDMIEALNERLEQADAEFRFDG